MDFVSDVVISDEEKMVIKKGVFIDPRVLNEELMKLQACTYIGLFNEMKLSIAAGGSFSAYVPNQCFCDTHCDV